MFHGKDKLILVIGSKGSGKSWSCLRIAKTINPYFRVEKDVVFSFEGLLDKLMDPLLPGGTVIIWEEVGTGFGAREFMKSTNIDVGKVLQTCRDKHCIILMNVPVQSFVDKTGRLLVHGIIEARGIDESRKENLVAYKSCDTNPMTGKTYNKFQRIYDFGHGRVTVLRLKKIEDEYIIAYESARKAFTTKLNEKAKAGKQALISEPEWKPRSVAQIMLEDKVKNWEARVIRERERMDHDMQLSTSTIALGPSFLNMQEKTSHDIEDDIEKYIAEQRGM